MRNGLSACVINHNGESYLAETLEALFAEGTAFEEVILVDDASTDRSLEIVRARFPSVRLLPLAENRGPAHARNVAFAAAREERVLFLDNDVRLLPGSVGSLEKALDIRAGAVFAMPRVLFASDPATIQFDGASSHFLGVMVPENERRPVAGAPSETRSIRSLITACFLVDRARWGETLLFDPSFFIYLEDHDLGYRARLKGLEILSVPAASCLHGMGTEGLSLRRGGRYTPMRVRCLIRNRCLVLLRNYSARTIALLFPALLLYEIAQLVVVVRKGWFGIWLGSVAWIAWRSRSIAGERRRIQKSRRLSDRAILSGGPLPLREEIVENALERSVRRALDAVFSGYWRIVSPLL